MTSVGSSESDSLLFSGGLNAALPVLSSIDLLFISSSFKNPVPVGEAVSSKEVVKSEIKHGLRP